MNGFNSPDAQMCFVNCGLPGDQCACYRQMMRDTMIPPVVLMGDGSVQINGELIPGKWSRAQFGAGYFEDGVISTDTMSLARLKMKLEEIYCESPSS